MANFIRITADGSIELLTHNVETRDELERLGLVGAKMVRVREVPAAPDPLYHHLPNPPPIDPIPNELRGRVGTVVQYEYVAAQVRLHRSRPGEPRETLTLPLTWLERHEG